MKVIKKILLIWFFAVLVFINSIAIKTQMEKEYEYSSGTAFVDRDEYLFTDVFQSTSDELIQYFRPVKNYLDIIEIRLAVNNENFDVSGWELQIDLCNSNDEVITYSVLNMQDFINWTYYSFNVDKTMDTGETYKLVLHQTRSSLHEPWPISVVGFINPENLKENIQCMYNGKVIEGNMELIYHYTYHKPEFILVVFLMDIIIILAILLGARIKKQEIQSKNTIFLEIHFLLSPIVFYLIIEGIIGNVETIKFAYVIANLICLFVLYILLIVCLGDLCVASILLGSSCAILALAEYYVTEFRGKDLSLFDLINIQTAFTVAGNYNFDLSIFQSVLLQILLLYFVMIYYHQEVASTKWKKKRKRIRILGGILLTGIFFVITNFYEIFFSELDMWDINKNYQEKGFIYSMFCWFPYINPEKPENYSIRQVKLIGDKISLKQEKVGVQPDNLIVIMNESFADFEIINSIQTNDKILPFWKTLNDNVIKGYLNVSVFGGGTCDTEWEFLTGNSKIFFPSYTIYPLYCNSKVYSIVDSLSCAGYDTVALHPYYAENWNRNIVYKNMGFDNFYSIENWGIPTEIIRWCASDASTYDKVIQLTSEKEQNKKLFIYYETKPSG